MNNGNFQIIFQNVGMIDATQSVEKEKYFSVNKTRVEELKTALNSVASHYEWKIDFRNKVIRNSLIKLNNKDLHERFLQGELNECEFESEVSSHPEKYFLAYKNTSETNEVNEILEIIKENADIRLMDMSDAQDLISAKIEVKNWLTNARN